MRRRWVLAGVLVVAMLCLGGYALARPGSKPKVSGWWSYPPLATTRHTAAPEYDCGAGGILATRGTLISAAHGTVGGHHWILETDQGRQGASSVRAGRFLLDGHAYGFCRDPVDLELIDAAPHGIVYGFAPRPFTPPIVIEATTAHGTAKHPVPAHNYPATTVHVPGGTVFVRALPASACAYNNVAVSLPKAPTPTGSSSETIIGEFMGACHPGRLVPTPHQGSGPSTPAVPPPAGLSEARRAQFITGRTVVGRVGCLACHEIGNQGNPGPGAPLSDIGSELTSAALTKNLVDPPAPMPSFKSLPGRELRAIVAFLSELRR